MAPQRGFSLLELLVTLLVIVVLISLATLGTGGAPARRLAEDVRHLEDVAAYARDEAAFSGRDFGLRLAREDREGDTVTVAHWRERGETGWRRPRGGAAVFEPLIFPADVEVELSLEGAAVVLDRGAGEAPADAPQVIFYASGEATPGSLTWRRADTGEFLWRTRWDLLGRLETTDDPLEARDA